MCLLYMLRARPVKHKDVQDANAYTSHGARQSSMHICHPKLFGSHCNHYPSTFE